MRAASGNVAAAVAAASLDETVDASVELFMPSSSRGAGAGGGAGGIAPPKGLCLVLPGFLLSARRSYRTLAAHLASHGFAAALVDADDPSASDAATARAVASAAAACAARASAAAASSRGSAPASPLPVMLIGHSRGAKVAALAAGGWERLAPHGNGSVGPRGAPRLAGLVLLDPVDRATLGPPPGPAYPSALPSVRSLASALPILIIGAGDNRDIVEPAAGWQAFAAAAEQGAAGGGAAGRGRVVELLLPRAKHLDFADTQSDPVVGGLLALAGGIFGAAAGAAGGAAAGGRAAGPPIGSSAGAGAVRRCADAAAAFWAAAVACCPAADNGGVGPVAAAAAVEAELAVLRRALVPDARWRVLAWPKGEGAAAAAAAAGGEGAQRAAATTTAAAAGATTREELMAMRASQLQAALREKRVYYGDCFDKPSLVERLLASGAG